MAHVIGQLAHVESVMFRNGKHVTLCLIVVSYAENCAQCI